jgi:Cu(I)/Ag(I) efflux system membrane protein CusA/SilA
MVIYIEEAVRRRHEEAGGTLTRDQLREAIVEGALLRLRPKVMTVSTVVAGLLPIMWSTQVGAEVMKPLATPVLGGMVSSLLHVLVVTPVIFFWLRERELGLRPAPAIEDERPEQARKRLFVAGIIAAILAIALFALWRSGGLRQADTADAGAIVHTERAGNLEILLRAPGGALRTGRNVFWIEFRRAADKALVDPGPIRASANMTMPGMVMSGGLRVSGTTVPGRFQATADFGMAGAWQMVIEWNDAAGPRSVAFQGMVQ